MEHYTIMAVRDVTNYNYGVVAHAIGIPLQGALFGAGYFNLRHGNPSNANTIYGLEDVSVNCITQGWNDYDRWMAPQK